MHPLHACFAMGHNPHAHMLAWLSRIPVTCPSRRAVHNGKQGSSALLQHRLLEGKRGVAQAGQEHKLEKGPPGCKQTVGFRFNPRVQEPAWMQSENVIGLTKGFLATGFSNHRLSTLVCKAGPLVMPSLMHTLVRNAAPLSPSSACCILDRMLSRKFCNR